MADVLYVLTESGSEFKVELDEGVTRVRRMSIMTMDFQPFAMEDCKIEDGPAVGRVMHGWSADAGNWCTSKVMRVLGPKEA